MQIAAYFTQRKAERMAAKVVILIAASFVFALLEIGKFAIKFLGGTF